MTEIHEQNVADAGTGGTLQTEDRIGGTNSIARASVGGLGAAAIALELKLGSSTAETLELGKRFEPILFFHPEEKFLPSNAKRYIEKCALWKAEAPFDTKDSFGGMGAPFPRSPLIAKGSITAIKTEPGTFLGDSLAESPVETRFIELGGWQDITGMAEPDVTATSNNIFADRNAIADQYKSGGALEDSTLWYHVEFFDNAKLKRLLTTVAAPDLVKVLSGLKNPALLCYYFFFPAHDQPLQAPCTFPEQGLCGLRRRMGLRGAAARAGQRARPTPRSLRPTLPCLLYWPDRQPALSRSRRKPSAAGRR
jgi:hypothetical protein